MIDFSNHAVCPIESPNRIFLLFLTGGVQFPEGFLADLRGIDTLMRLIEDAFIPRFVISEPCFLDPQRKGEPALEKLDYWLKLAGIVQVSKPIQSLFAFLEIDLRIAQKIRRGYVVLSAICIRGIGCNALF